MPLQRVRTCTAAFAAITLLASSGASAAPQTSLDPLVALSILSTSESRAAVCSSASGSTACRGGSMAAVSAGAAATSAAQDDGVYAPDATERGSMWPLWVGLGAVAIFIAWDLLEDDDDDGEIQLPISP